MPERLVVACLIDPSRNCSNLCGPLYQESFDLTMDHARNTGEDPIEALNDLRQAITQDPNANEFVAKRLDMFRANGRITHCQFASQIEAQINQ